jgi:hypothetical protein
VIAQSIRLSWANAALLSQDYDHFDEVLESAEAVLQRSRKGVLRRSLTVLLVKRPSWVVAVVLAAVWIRSHSSRFALLFDSVHT